MKDPIENVKAALRNAGAIYRGGGSKSAATYYFEDGEAFVFERKSSNPDYDARTAMRKLNQVLARRQGAVAMPVEMPVETIRTNGAIHEILAPVPEGLVFHTPKSESMKERWASAVTQAEAYVEKLKTEIAMASRRVDMLQSMIPFVEDPAFADTLRAILPVEAPQAPVVVAPVLPPPPPQQIHEHVHVTRELVFVATQTFISSFTVNDVVERMLNGKVVDKKEWQRIRMSIATAMTNLCESGRLNREQQGIGRQQTIWSKMVQQNKVTPLPMTMEEMERDQGVSGNLGSEF